MEYPILRPVIFLFLTICPALLYAQQQGQQADTSAGVIHSAKNGKVLKGIASYYHDKFEGRKMANGKIYYKAKLTAACNVLPLNKWVKVTSLLNDRSVIVRITDRMHPKNKRLIDLSLAAAKELKMISRGLMKVKIEALDGYNPVP